MLKNHSKKHAIRNNLIRIGTVIVMTLLLNKVFGLPVFLSIIIGYITGLALMLLVTYVFDKKTPPKSN